MGVRCNFESQLFSQLCQPQMNSNYFAVEPRGVPGTILLYSQLYIYMYIHHFFWEPHDESARVYESMIDIIAPEPNDTGGSPSEINHVLVSTLTCLLTHRRLNAMQDYSGSETRAGLGDYQSVGLNEFRWILINIYLLDAQSTFSWSFVFDLSFCWYAHQPLYFEQFFGQRAGTKKRTTLKGYAMVKWLKCQVPWFSWCLGDGRQSFFGFRWGWVKSYCYHIWRNKHPWTSSFRVPFGCQINTDVWIESSRPLKPPLMLVKSQNFLLQPPCWTCQHWCWKHWKLIDFFCGLNSVEHPKNMLNHWKHSYFWWVEFPF